MPPFVLPWLGFLLGLLICSLPLMAMAIEFKPPRRGVPGRREGAGTRSPQACVQGNLRLTALMPPTNLGLTTAAYPRFFWYIPKTRAKLAEFSLAEINEATGSVKVPVYKTTFGIAGVPGVASLPLPRHATIPPLTVGQDYRWSLALICNPDRREQDIKVDGWVQRITPNAELTEKLAKATATDRPLIYANSGIWFDTLTSLADLHCANPQNTSHSASWAELLKSVKLAAIATQPLVQSCTPGP
ncbi:MAG: DUF928 domain-containing protein [Kovacikia sp.]